MKVDAPTHEEREKSWCKERQHWPWWADVPQNANAAIMGEYEGRLTRAEKRAWSYGYHVNQGAGDLSKFPDRTPQEAQDGGWQKFCPECDGFMRKAVDEAGAVCEACGFMGEDVLEAGPISDYVIKDANKKKEDARAEQYATRLKRINAFLKSKGIDTDGTLAARLFENRAKASYVPRKTRHWETAHIDTKLYDLMLDPNMTEYIIDPFPTVDYLKPPKLLKVYNNNIDEYYAPITIDQVRASVVRQQTHLTATVDKFIDQILRYILHHDIADKIHKAQLRHLLTAPRDRITEKHFHNCFVYVGTHRIERLDNYKKDKSCDHFIQYFWNKKNAKAIQRLAQIDQREYVANDKNKTIVFTLFNDEIQINGDEIDDQFENFFLAEAINRGYLGEIPPGPDAKLIEESFLTRFRQNNHFRHHRSPPTAPQ